MKISENDYLIKKWNWSENYKIGLTPSELTCASRKKAWWMCKEGHVWQARISHVYYGHDCPYCSGRMAISGTNDLQTLFPKIAAEWDVNKNLNVLPCNIKAHSNKKFWWTCARGHEYQASPAKRVEGVGCPYCAGKKVLEEFNSLSYVNPSLAKEWDYERNKGLTPLMVTEHSGKKVWWKCAQGHLWRTSVDTRSRGRGCPCCSNKSLLRGFNDLQSKYPEIAKEWDYEKNNEIIPTEVLYGSAKKVWWKCVKGHSWETPIVYRTSDGTGCPICAKSNSISFPEKTVYFYINQQFSDCIENYKLQTYNNREIDIFIPQYLIGIEYDGDIWHKNIERDIEKKNICKKLGITLIRIREPDCEPLFSSSIDYEMKSHSEIEYNNAVIFTLNKLKQMTNRDFVIDVDIGRDSPRIAEMVKTNTYKLSLSERNPQLAKEWHPTKNGALLPENFLPNSGYKAWWLCSNGHEWQATIASRNGNNTGCPYCKGKRCISGVNDLETLYPEISKEWNYERNEGRKPSEFTARGSKKVWWRCQYGHEWQAIIENRTRKGYGCPYCSGRYAIKKS